MGGEIGHCDHFYGPMVISVVKQDIEDPNKRTPDHVQMRTLRQVADYIQMADSAPVPNPTRFLAVPHEYHPEPGLALIPGIKIHDLAELDIMRSFGKLLWKEEVLVSVSRRAKRQGPAAVPFMLGLRWYTRQAELDLRIKSSAVNRAEPDLLWAQWELEIAPPDPTRADQKKAGVVFAHIHRTIVLVQGGGAPLRIKHVKALTMYLHMNQETTKDRAAISREGFQAYWQEKYGDNDIASPYDLEASHPANLFEDYTDVIQAFEMATITAKKAMMKRIFHVAATRAEILVFSLIKEYADDEQIVRIVEALIDRYIKKQSGEAMQATLAMAGDFSEQKIEATRVVEQLGTLHAQWELEPVAQFFNKFKERHYLTWFRRELMTS